jgi:alpha-L-fucosidase
VVRRLQPEAVIFSDAGPDVRWCGNERGTAGDPNWSTVDPAAVPYPGADGPGIIAALQHGDPQGTVWRPAEVDVSIRPGWFYHPAEDARVRSVDDLVELYFTSVGRNGKLLLNVPPTRDGLLHPTDVARLAGLRAVLARTFGTDRAADAARSAARDADATYVLPEPRTVAIARLSEDIARGQHVARYTLEGGDDAGVWRTLSQGTTIGYAKLDRFPATTLRRVRLRIEESAGAPGPVGIQLFG